MEESMKKPQEGGDKEILYSRAIKAGKRIYYLDVKKNLRDDMFLAITESKKIQHKEGERISFEKHKIFLYKEDFDKFIEGINDVISYIKKCNGTQIETEEEELEEMIEEECPKEEVLEEIKIEIDF